MISVEFKKLGTGTCQWCCKERADVYTVAFGDRSFIGDMCKADLFRAIGMRLGVGEARTVDKSKMPLAVPANGQA